MCVCVCVCVCVCTCVCVSTCVHVLRIVSTNKILLFINTLITIVIIRPKCPGLGQAKQETSFSRLA